MVLFNSKNNSVQKRGVNMKSSLVVKLIEAHSSGSEDAFKNALNINTQKGYGLDFIGRLVKQSRLLTDFSQDIHFVLIYLPYNPLPLLDHIDQD